MPRSAPKGGSSLTPRRIAAGLLAFSALGALGLWATSRLDPSGSTSLRAVATAVPASSLVLAIGLVFGDYLLGALRLHVWIRRVAPGTSWTASSKAYMVNMFAAAISPMGSASAPAQIAVLARSGVPPARALAALLVNFIGLLSAFLVIGGGSGAYLAARADLDGTPGLVIRSLLLIASGAMVLIVVVVGNPEAGARLARGLVGIGERHAVARLERLGRGLARQVGEYRRALETLKAGWWTPFALATSLSAAMLLNKCLVGYVLARGLGFQGRYVEVAARQSLQWLLIYFSPSPGGSGVAEASVPAFLGGIVPPGSVVEFTVLWRGLTAVLGAGLGALVALWVFSAKRDGRRP